MNEIPAEVRKTLHAYPNVHSVGYGFKYSEGKKTGGEAICVGVGKKLALAELTLTERIPINVDGVPVDIWEFTEPRANYLWKPLTYNGFYDVIPGGTSCGHPLITAGTHAGLCTLIGESGKLFSFSNNHVLANSNNANIGDPAFYPGPYDGGTMERAYAKLAKFIPIKFVGGAVNDPCKKGTLFRTIVDIFLKIMQSSHRLTFYSVDSPINYVDAAVAEITDVTKFMAEVKDVGLIMGITDFELGDEIHYTGRTTEHSDGMVEQVWVSLNVSYGEGNLAYFEDQVLGKITCAGGNSGSGVYSTPKNLIGGLLFAGSDPDIMIMNRITNVIDALGIERFVNQIESHSLPTPNPDPIPDGEEDTRMP